jgi:hypothetical protein
LGFKKKKQKKTILVTNIVGKMVDLRLPQGTRQFQTLPICVFPAGERDLRKRRKKDLSAGPMRYAKLIGGICFTKEGRVATLHLGL